MARSLRERYTASQLNSVLTHATVRLRGASKQVGGTVMATKKAAKKYTSTRKYSPSASQDVEREMKAMKQGKLKSGRNGKTVTNPKQAMAIGLSEARKEG